MVQHRVVLLSGDGIGPEITAVARRLLEAVSERHGFSLTFDEQLIGGAAIDGTGDPLPASTLERVELPMPCCWLRLAALDLTASRVASVLSPVCWLCAQG